MKAFHVVIPARFGSTRLPGKPLADLAGKPMVVRVVEAALRATPDGVWVATDDERVIHAVETHGYRAVMTSAAHASGTDRIAEVARLLGWDDDDIVVNVQGDEPLIDPDSIRACASALVEDTEAAIATAAHPITDVAEFFNPNVVKVVTAASGRALYFSRAPMPWHRDGFGASRDLLPDGFAPLRHIGLYAYRVAFLKRYSTLAPAPCETWEALEQLRAIWHGYAIRVVCCDAAPAPGVDTAADLDRVRKKFLPTAAAGS